jgi:polysaccharide export outer membrane protein/exopolysaccharide production protein ExoF
MWHRLRVATAIALALCLCVAGGGAAAAEAYLLGPQDKVRLKVYEWRASRDAIFEWTALNDQFTVSAAGTLSLPFVGDIKAEGVTPSDLALVIGDALMQRMGLGRRPDASVEVVQFRPFYILGHVAEPGEFPYRPGLTVLQAVGIAGGLRIREEGSTRFEREMIAGKGEINLFALSNVSLIAQKARLEAELSGAEAIKFPAQLTERESDPSIALLMQQERAIFDARRQGLATQLQALEGLRNFLQAELVSLKAQLGYLDKQISLLEKELRNVSSLVNKGLAVAPRQMELERTFAQFQSNRLSAETSLLRAQQEVSRTDLTILELRNKFKNEATVTLRETQGSLEELGHKADTALQLLYESQIAGPKLLAQRARAAKAEPIYTIVRPRPGSMVELAAAEATLVEPGDSIKVELPFPEGLEGDRMAAPVADLAAPAGKAKEALFQDGAGRVR